ncbi:unnamed protein product [Dovyalis caffra]|uniref:Uncharacterized protein n=1 Tax=Dovyalis caffra TaxID=77055 RepID=A0AAV1SQ12_9ROSI|nr:unnamed protein product [Dovyalis caffra]
MVEFFGGRTASIAEFQSHHLNNLGNKHSECVCQRQFRGKTILDQIFQALANINFSKG